MGKRNRGSVLRAKKRADAAQQEIVEAEAHQVETGHITSQSNEQLFVLDTSAATVPKSLRPPKDKKPKHNVTQEKVQALLAKHDAATLQAMASSKSSKKKRTSTSFDLWGEEEASTKNQPQNAATAAGVAPPKVVTKARPAAKRTKPSVAVDVAQSGQSYHPDLQEHQNVIGEALALELKRKEALDYKKAPLTTGMSEETKAIMMDSSSEDDEDESNSDNDDGPTFHKHKEKLTRAQRNRQKRIRAQQREERERKQQKKRMNAVGEAKTLAKRLKRQEAERQERKLQLEALKTSEKRVLGKGVVQFLSEKNPVAAPTLPVALTEELSGTLRTMKPKGSLLTDRMESFKDRQMAESKRTRKTIVQGNKRRKLKIKGKHGNEVTDEMGQDYLLMG